tara:strand:- start:4285 stop:11019 length:6735 start_codon:yes stop_codon:yes gene_type:complete
MPLSRLENFLKNAEGNILYVNPSDFDATDSIENRGNSLTRPFKTIQRALIEAARFSYQTGKNNDKIDRTTILTFPGVHYIDNRPGYTVTNNSGTAEYKAKRNSSYVSVSLNEFTTETNFDILDTNNDLYKYNSVEGGVILPRGTSIIGFDLRKTKIKPLWVPEPELDYMEYSSVFRVTGTCYFTAFSIFDADISKVAYYDFDSNTKSPTFSHHKLSCFQYADGMNNILIDGTDSGLTDLEMYYYKVAKAYGDASGRPVGDYPTFTDFEPNVDEFRIVGDLAADPVGITSIKAGDGNTSSTVITVTTSKNHNLFKETPVLIAGITTSINSYNGSFLVDEVTSDTEFKYIAPSAPGNPLPIPQEIQNSSVIIEPDTVGSASPYVFNCSLRSVYGMNGMDCNGDKATGFKSMVVAQFTGISIQKDDNAFILYNPDTAIFNDDTSVSDTEKPLHSNSRAIYKPTYETSHMRVRNNAVVQIVSVFAIAYARHFHAERGGDASITNSNSNFGQTGLESEGFRPSSFDRDDVGYITHVIPPRELTAEAGTISWLTLDVQKTVSIANTSRLYLYGYDTKEVSPPTQVDSYRVGAQAGEHLYLSLIDTLSGQAIQQTYQAPVLMQVESGIGTSKEKVYDVIRNAGVNYIVSNVFGLDTNHQLITGEKVRIFSDTGETPNGVENDKIYYAITGGSLAADRMQLAATFNDAIARRPKTGLSNGGGRLKVSSTVSDKNAGDPGHPIQWDASNSNWYVTVAPQTLYNTIYPNLVSLGVGVIGEESGSTYMTRRVDNRSLNDRLYRVRYVIPKEHTTARAPTPGYVLQESKTVGVGSASYLTADLTNPTQLKNVKIVKTASFNSNTITIVTEKAHKLYPNDVISIKGVVSANNTLGTYGAGYNGENVVGDVISQKQFTITGITTDPGAFLNEVNQRTTQQQIEALPTVQRTKSFDTINVYRVQEAKPHIPGTSGQDGVYNLTLLCGSIALDKDLGFGVSMKSFSQDVKNLYPQQDRDNYNSDPEPATSFATPEIVGKVITSDRKNSVTRESLNYFMQGFNVGVAVTGAVITGSGSTTITLYSDTEHNFNSVKEVNLVNPGSGYNNGSGIATVIYAADLVNNGLIGRNAAAEVSVSAAGTITDVKIIDGGCAYGVGNTMTISAFPAGSPTTDAVVEVTSIFDNRGDGLDMSGFVEPKHNGTFKIVDIPTAKSVSIENSRDLGPYYVDRTDRRNPQYSIASPGVAVTSIDVTRETGITTVRCSSNHTLVAGNTFSIVGTGNTLWDDKRFVVEDVETANTLRGLKFNVGIITAGINVSYATTDATLLGHGIRAKSKSLSLGENNLAARTATFYVGISTTLAVPLTSTDSNIILTNTAGFRRGDYCLIGAEIVRFTNNNINTIIRGQFGTIAAAAVAGSTIKKVEVLPMELRRPSILRASGHTFEYLGYGSGNYSTSLPQKQDRVLNSDEQLTAQKKEQDGGKVVYTGMNDSGEFFTGYNKLSAITGEEEIIGAPVFTYTGDDAESEATKKLSGVFDELLVREGITVEGGDNNNRTSQFYGPVNTTQKLTNNSEEGIETVNLYIKGSAPQGKLLTVGISTPTQTKRSGDISFISTPDAGGHMGWIQAEGEWRRFGVISQERDRDFYKIDQVGIGQSAGVFNFTDALEVNGTVKINHLYVAGIVTFSSNQTFSGVTYDTIIVRKTANFYGFNTSGGISTAGIPWENYGYYTQVHEAGTSRLFNLETVGTYVSFKPASHISIEGPINDTYAGVSTFVGTLDVGNLECDGGSVNVTFLTGVQAGIDTLAVHKTFSALSGVITNFHSTVGVVTNGLYADVGVTTLSHVGTQWVGTSNVYTGITTQFLASNHLQTPQAYIASGIVTNITGTNLTYENISGVAGTCVDFNFTDQLFGPSAFVNTGIITGIKARYLGGQGNSGPGQPSLDVNINSGIITSLVGTAGTFQNIYMNSGGKVTTPFIYGNTGIITNFGDGSTNITGKFGPTGTVEAFTLKSTAAQGVAPLIVTSTTKVTNLNVDYLDGLNSSSTDQSGASIVSRSSGSFSGNVITANAFNGGSGSFSSLSCSGTLSHTGSSASLNNLTVTGTFAASGSFSGNAASADIASNVTGSGGRVLYNSSNNNTTTSSNLAFDGSNLSVGGDITAFASDIRLKSDIRPIDSALERVGRLKGFTYEFNETGKGLGLPEGRHSGVSAQDVQEVLPEAVTTRTNDEYLTVKYDKLVPLLIEAIKEQQTQIDELQAQIEELK